MNKRDYDARHLDRHIVEVCDHYLPGLRAEEGSRYTYPCPGCGERDFEADPDEGTAGCYDPDCSAPNSASAAGIVAYFENHHAHNTGYLGCLRRGYEILGLGSGASTQPPREPSEDPSEEFTHDCAHDESDATEAGHGEHDAADPATNPQQTPGGDQSPVTDQHHPDIEEGTARHNGRWQAATGTGDRPPADPGDNHGADPSLAHRAVSAWFTDDSGDDVETAAYIVDDEEDPAVRHTGPQTHPEADAGGATHDTAGEEPPAGARWQPPPGTPTVSTTAAAAHEVYAVLLELCPVERRDRPYFKHSGLLRANGEATGSREAASEDEDHTGGPATGVRIGSISPKRCAYVLENLRQRFTDKQLLEVPGFYVSQHSGELAFSLHGDYALIAHHDSDGYIRTIEAIPPQPAPASRSTRPKRPPAATSAARPDPPPGTAQTHKSARRSQPDSRPAPDATQLGAVDPNPEDNR